MSKAKNPSINVLKRDNGAARVGTGSGETVQQEIDKRTINAVSTARYPASSDRNKVVNAVAEAISNGSRAIILADETLTFSPAVDCQGVDVIGRQTVVNGDLINTGTLKGVVINSQPADTRAMHPPIRVDNEPKLLRRKSASEYQAIIRKASKGYLLVDFRNNVTTAFESLAGGTNDTTSWRVTAITNCVDALVGYNGANASQGTWTDQNLSVGVAEAFNAGIEYKYKQSTGGDIGDFYEMAVEVPADGEVTLSFIRSSGSCADVSLSIDGTDVEANISLVAASAEIKTFRFTAEPGTRLVRVTRNVVSGSINLIGCNFAKLKDTRLDVSLDQYGYYRNSTNYADYLINTSANDYAIRDADADTWGGSYHGGETAITTKWLMDGNEQTLATGDMVVGSLLSLEQSFTLDWSAIGGGSLEAFTQHTFFSGGYNLETAFSGFLNCESFFTTLYGIDEAFSLVKSPKAVDLSTDVADGGYAYYGRQNRVVYATPGSDQKIKITHSQFLNEENQKGGAYTWRVVGEYHKYYYSFLDRGYRPVSSLAAVNVFEFE